MLWAFPFGSGFPFIRAQALGAGLRSMPAERPVSIAIPNAASWKLPAAKTFYPLLRFLYHEQIFPIYHSCLGRQKVGRGLPVNHCHLRDYLYAAGQMR